MPPGSRSIARKRGNSFRRETLDEIRDAVERAGDGPGIRSVVITAAGSRFFSTGGDVVDYNTRYTDDLIGMKSYERAMERTFSEIMHCPKPVIHRVNGDVVGGANAFHLAADFVVMNRPRSSSRSAWASAAWPRSARRNGGR